VTPGRGLFLAWRKKASRGARSGDIEAGIWKNKDMACVIDVIYCS